MCAGPERLFVRVHDAVLHCRHAAVRSEDGDQIWPEAGGLNGVGGHGLGDPQHDLLSVPLLVDEMDENIDNV
jgi:hypothetical protein